MENVYKVIRVLLNTLVTLIIIVGSIFIILMLIGIEPYVVESGSMQPAVETGSLSFINKHAKYQDIKVNDIIAFKSTTGNRVSHRVVNITDEGLETKGDCNEDSDGITTTEKNLIGKHVFSIPKLGYLVYFIKSTKGKIMLITLIIVILIAGFLNDAKKKEKSCKKEE